MYTALTAVNPHTTVTFSQIRECNRRGFTWQTPDHDHTAWIGDAWWHHTEAQTYTVFLSCGESDTVSAAAAALIHRLILQPERYHLFPDTLQTLAKAKESGFRNVLLSNNYPDMHGLLQTLGLTPYLDGVILSAEEGYDKPRKELFDIAKSRFPDANYYMVGDSVNADIMGGRKAGMMTVLVHNGISPLADFSTDSLHEALTYIQKQPSSNK